ncbi:MAG: hypothetical protein ACOCRX_09900 [Candidatus Woesearchaeota archaeon]
MYVWFGITLISLILSIIFWLLYKRTKRKISYFDEVSNWIVGPLVGFIMIFIILIISCPVIVLVRNEEIREFEMYQEMINETYNEGDLTDVGINSKVVEMNMWLLEARRNEDLYGVFSFYYGELDDLEYIKINTE